MKLIELKGEKGTGKYVQVSDEDYEYLNQFKWFLSQATKNRNPGPMYAFRTQWLTGQGKGKNIPMHREILNIIDRKDVCGDHKDRNGLNNQRENLRIATKSQNNVNKKKLDNSTSKYMGVYKKIRKYLYTDTDYWIGSCSYKNKIYSKQFRTEMEAALWYNEIAKRLHGEFAITNEITKEDIEIYTQYQASIPKCGERKCWLCYKILPETSFYKNKGKTTGYHSYCKECTKKPYEKRNKRRSSKEDKCS